MVRLSYYSSPLLPRMKFVLIMILCAAVMAVTVKVRCTKELKRVIPTAAAFGGAILGLLSLLPICWCIGSGTGILMALLSLQLCVVFFFHHPHDLICVFDVNRLGDRYSGIWRTGNGSTRRPALNEYFMSSRSRSKAIRGKGYGRC